MTPYASKRYYNVLIADPAQAVTVDHTNPPFPKGFAFIHALILFAIFHNLGIWKVI